MRVLFATDWIGGGGVLSYLAALAPALAARGHAVSLLHAEADGAGQSPPAATPRICAETLGVEGALAAAAAWAPDVVFSHNMRPLDLERGLLAVAPVVKMMHAYAGTCIGGQKTHL